VLKIKFWGTRGSIPVCGKKYVKYGGNTPCLEVRTDQGHLIIIDCGSGIREMGYQLMEEGFDKGGCSAVILLSHCHWDHIQGMPFFRPAYVKGNRFIIYGLHSFYQTLEKSLVGQMQCPYFPSRFFEMGAEFNIREIPECKFNIGDLSITTAYMNHPDETFGFRIDYHGKSFVYASDNEHIPSAVADDKVIQFSRKTDLLIHDSQFMWDEYFGNKVGWGHSVPEVALQTAQLSEAKKLILFHHDPSHNDQFLDNMLEYCKNLNAGYHGLEIDLARDFMEIIL